jgi:hypothetical protein
MDNFLKDQNVLIFDLIFGDKFDFKIDISDYVSDIYKYEDFIDDIKMILKRSKVKIISNDIKIDSKTAIWELKVKK